MKRALIVTATLLGLGLRAATAQAAAVSTAAASSEVQASTTVTVASIYTVDRLRDPFLRWGASKGPARPFSLEDFSIHKLSLRGLMKDAASDFALFVDNEAAVSFLLRRGRLYDLKNKPVPGVGGSINIKEKMATLTAPEGDVQVFRLGEEEKE